MPFTTVIKYYLKYLWQSNNSYKEYKEMNKSKSPSPTKGKDKGHSFKKTIHNYTISYCQKQFLGRSLYGQVRLGYENDQKKVRAFRINSLPMSEQAKANLSLQKYYSQLGQCSPQIYESFQSQTNRYTVMQYFPKTFKTQLSYFRKLTKNLEPYIEKFLQTYSKLYYFRIIHGNISLENIGITFDGKVKLMDYRSLSQLSFQEGSMKDYRDFRSIICHILERDKIFPSNFQVFDDPDGNWQKLFSAWHVVNVYQYIYRQKKQFHQNICVLISKLQSTIYPQDDEIDNKLSKSTCQIKKEDLSQSLRLGLRLLLLSSLKKIPRKSKAINFQITQLEKILEPIQKHNINYYNSLLWGVINDPFYYNIHQTQRLTLIMCLLPSINHQYFYMQIIKQFEPNKDEATKFGIFADGLLLRYGEIMSQNLIKL